MVRSLFIRSYLVFDRKRDLRLKQVAIDDQLELPALKSCQVFRDGKSKSASLRGSGNVTTDESLGELIRADVSRVCGHILDREHNVGAMVLDCNIDAGSF